MTKINDILDGQRTQRAEKEQKFRSSEYDLYAPKEGNMIKNGVS